ncbi:MAG: hypothetical protein HRT88_20230 [Lentisphaeraceae bacterium]|nr:hypothetical protein [Lentisphaeraceae bacterium]
MKRRNFTLMELIIALSLFALLSLICMGLLKSVIDSLKTQKEHSKKVGELVILNKTTKKMFANMVPFSWRDEENQKVPHFGGGPEYMRFVYLNRVNSPQDGGLRFCEIFVNDDAELVVQYQTRPFRHGYEINEEHYLSILARKVQSVSFQYASAAEDQQSSAEMEWLEEWKAERLDIPLAILMTITWENENVESFMWRTAGNSFYERHGAWKNGEEIQ